MHSVFLLKLLDYHSTILNKFSFVVFHFIDIRFGHYTPQHSLFVGEKMLFLLIALFTDYVTETDVTFEGVIAFIGIIFIEADLFLALSAEVDHLG